MFLFHFESQELSNDLTSQQNHKYISNLKDSQAEIASSRKTPKHSHLILIALQTTAVSVALILIFSSAMGDNPFSPLSMMSCCISLTFFPGCE